MSPDQEWIDQHTPSPEVLAKIRKQRGIKAECSHRSHLGQAREGVVDQARRHLGGCGIGDGEINFGDCYVRRGNALYHEDCDPGKPPPTCGGCGIEVGQGYSECQDCFDNRMAKAYGMTVKEYAGASRGETS